MTNKEIANTLSETADLMEIAGMDGFRIRSYRNAAVVIESHTEGIADIVRDSGRDVTTIKGIGKGIASALHELVERGSFERRDELLEKYPPTTLELLKIPGLGPKSIALIYGTYRVSTIEALEELCREHKLQELPRMGEKLEQKILRGIENYKRGAGRFLVDLVDRAAEELVAYLSEVEGVEKITPAGSLRRGKETIGDLDLLVTGPNARAALDHFVKHPEVKEVLGHGETKASARIGAMGLQVDVRAVNASSYGAAMMYFTGSKEHNVAIRDRAVRMGLSLNEYGLKRTADGEIVAAGSEEEIYGKLGLPWIAPELRENTGEIEAALDGELPKLVELGDVHCDVHMHTHETDGHHSIAEMAEAGKKKGYTHIAITDHSQALAMANGLDEKRLLEQIEEVRRVSDEFEDFTILAGCEVDILKDGRMDIDDEVLAQLDVVIASVHSYMNLEEAEMTERLLRVVENPYVSILGHPTGRLLLRREPYSYDFERIADEAGRRGIRMEINASPGRLDLDATHLRIAKTKGVKFVISTDAHDTRHLDNMKYGVAMARRGWLEAGDVLNTLPLGEFRKAVRRD
ncbi:MAG: DNA polymerase/3'-5' exonuclease PolX [Acidobacteria bacterium]|nr:DNA polymerase/3'-5' exonuclease PolX [Acidobacteriota bacterium]